MNLFDKLTSENFTAYAMKCYDNPQCETMEEFHEDLNRFKYLKRLLYRYQEEGVVRERLMLNHIITLVNVFGVEPCLRMMEFKVTDVEHWTVLKTIFVYLGYVGDNWRVDIPLDTNFIRVLREL